MSLSLLTHSSKFPGSAVVTIDCLQPRGKAAMLVDRTIKKTFSEENALTPHCNVGMAAVTSAASQQ